MVIPMFENWAMTLAEQGDGRAALALATEIEQLADEVAAREDVYARAAGWPPRVGAWLAELYTVLGDEGAAARAREESRRKWTAVAARAELPPDLTAEANAALSGGREPRQ
jgi:hypothetical protein